MSEQEESQRKSRSKKDTPELETFRTEFRRLVGGAIVEGLIEPTMTLANVGKATDYDQNSTGNYTQVGGGHDQVGGNYDQTANRLPPRLGGVGVVVLDDRPVVIDPGP